MKPDIFKFKQFEVRQEQVPMKVGTDGVLLGAWAEPGFSPLSILDIGAGTGILALMMAQRFHNAEIDAVERYEPAYEQCVYNFEHAPWNDRLFCYHADFRMFADQWEDTYEMIISNPPFFQNNREPSRTGRALARQEFALPFETLLFGTAGLLAPTGACFFIIPYEVEGDFLELAEQVGLSAVKITRVRGRASSVIKRSLLHLVKSVESLQTDELIIEVERHKYTQEYQELTAPFYLNM